jgi:hypothetical protein
MAFDALVVSRLAAVGDRKLDLKPPGRGQRELLRWFEDIRSPITLASRAKRGLNRFFIDGRAAIPYLFMCSTSARSCERAERSTGGYER